MTGITSLDILYVSLAIAVIAATIAWCVFLVAIVRNLREVLIVIKSIVVAFETASKGINAVKSGVKYGALSLVQNLLEAVASNISSGGEKNAKKSRK